MVGALGWGNEEFVCTVFFLTRACYTALQVLQGHIFGDVKIASQVDDNNLVISLSMAAETTALT